MLKNLNAKLFLLLYIIFFLWHRRDSNTHNPHPKCGRIPITVILRHTLYNIHIFKERFIISDFICKCNTFILNYQTFHQLFFIFNYFLHFVYKKKKTLFQLCGVSSRLSGNILSLRTKETFFNNLSLLHITFVLWDLLKQHNHFVVMYLM